MIKLTDLLTEDIDSDSAKEIISTLEKAEKIILKGIKRNNQLKRGKIKWKTNGSKYPGHIDFSKYWDLHKDVFSVELRVIVSEDGEDYIADIYVAGYVADMGSNKGEIVYKANVFESSGLGNTFETDRNLFRYLEDTLKDFEFSTRIKQ